MSDSYIYQEKVKELILTGHSVILQAPTGAGADGIGGDGNPVLAIVRDSRWSKAAWARVWLAF